METRVKRWTREAQLGWAAGVFDGEGSTVISVTGGDPKRNRPSRCLQLKVGFNQKYHPEIVHRFHQVMGTGRINYNAKRLRHTFFAHNYQALVCLQLMWPYLSEVKRRQARVALGRWREWINR